MRGINFLAGLGTILIFTGVFCCKAALDKKTFHSNRESSDAPVKNYRQMLLLISGVLCIIAGILLILKSMAVV